MHAIGLMFCLLLSFLTKLLLGLMYIYILKVIDNIFPCEKTREISLLEQQKELYYDIFLFEEKMLVIED